MKKNFFKMLTSITMALILSVSCAVSVFANEIDTPVTINVDGLNPTTTLPAGVEYTIFNSASFTNQENFGYYYIQGRWLNLKFGFKTASFDAGIGGINITVSIYDSSTGQLLGRQVEENPSRDSYAYTEMTFDLGSFGKTVYINFDASSNGESNGHYRSATIINLRSYVFGD